MRIRIYEVTENGSLDNEKTFDVASKNKFDAIEEAAKMYLPDEDLSSSGIYEIYDAMEGAQSSYRGHKGGCSYRRISAIITGKGAPEMSFMGVQGHPKRKDGSEMDIYLGVDLYEPGYVLSTGETLHGLYSDGPGYLRSFSTTKTGIRLRSSGIENAKRFKSRKAVLDFVKKNEDKLQAFTDQNGLVWSMKWSSVLFEEDERERLIAMNQKQKEKEIAIWKEAESLLASINASLNVPDLEEEEEYDEETKVEDENLLKEEAVRRMKDLNILPQTIREFEKEGVINRSEHGGMLYWADDEASKKALSEARKAGLYPYHIVYNNTTIGEMLSVLYVSKYKCDWRLERYRQKDKLISAYVYNTDLGSADMGDIRVVPANGGLVREA